jgi:hypothetical protein
VVVGLCVWAGVFLFQWHSEVLFKQEGLTKKKLEEAIKDVSG